MKKPQLHGSVDQMTHTHSHTQTYKMEKRAKAAAATTTTKGQHICGNSFKTFIYDMLTYGSVREDHSVCTRIHGTC